MVQTETFYEVCDCCNLAAANDDGCDCDSTYHPEGLLGQVPGYAYSVCEEPTEWREDEATGTDRAYDEDGNPIEHPCGIGTAGRWWECEGCGGTPGMMADVHTVAVWTD